VVGHLMHFTHLPERPARKDLLNFTAKYYIIVLLLISPYTFPLERNIWTNTSV